MRRRCVALGRCERAESLISSLDCCLEQPRVPIQGEAGPSGLTSAEVEHLQHLAAARLKEAQEMRSDKVALREEIDGLRLKVFLFRHMRTSPTELIRIHASREVGRPSG